MKYEFFIGARFLRSKKGQAFISLISFLSIAGVTVGVMALIVVIGVMAGTEIELKKRLLERQPHILIMNYSGPVEDYSRIVNKVQDMPEVVSAAPFVHSPVMLRSASGMKGAYLKGIRPAKNQSGYAETDPEYLIQNIEKKDSFNDEGTVSIIIGKPLAEQLEVKKGDSLGVMMFSENREASSARLPSMQRVKVFAIFDSGLYQLDKNFVGMPLEDALGLLGKSGEVTGVEVRVKDVLKSEEIARKISAILDFPYWARDWTKANQNIFSSIRLQKTVMFIILTLIVLVAGFSITSSLMMMVMEKTKDISILMAMGASRGSIRKIFIFKGMVIGLTGTSLGMIFGFGLCALLAWYPIIELPEEIYYFSRLPVHLTGVDVLIITASALLICFLSTIYPAQKASRLVPVVGIRKGM